jgi:hypothetical protein
MATRKSSTLLPEIFRSSKNKKFLNATLDQLISEPAPVKINSYIGRKNSAGYVVGDGYLQETTVERQNFQLEPAVIYKDSNKKIDSVHMYTDMLNAVNYYNGNSTKTTDLFAQDYYNWSGFVDYDKLVNYGEYFWLPEGPDSVQVFSSAVDTQDSFKVLRESVNYERYPFDSTNFDAQPFDGVTTDIAVGEPFYRFDDVTSNPNPTLYLARGGEYTFEVEQEGVPFWIQTERGLSGESTTQGNVSTREVAGVTNNGAEVGTITWRVPTIDSQNSLVEMVQQHTVDFATHHTYKELQNRVLSDFFAEHQTGIDGVTQIDGKTIIFATTNPDADEWEQGSLYDSYGYDSNTDPVTLAPGSFDTTTTLTFDERYGVFRVNIVNISGTDTIQLTRLADIDRLKKVGVKSGVNYGNREFERTAEGFLQLIPPITAIQDTLFYQDGVDANRFGKIVLVDPGNNAKINVVDDILGQPSYASPNGVNFINGLKVEFNSDVIPSTYAGEWYVEGVGTEIQLVNVDSLKTPEPYSETLVNGYDSDLFDNGGLEQTKDAPILQDYILINRASSDLNAWSRYNRWFHRRVIEATATLNGFNPTIEETARAKRPIIEFDAGLQLFNYGTNGKRYVDVIDVTQTDALSNVNGAVGYFSEQFNLTPGVTVVFTQDLDTRQNVYQVKKVDEDNDSTTSKIIVLERIDTIEPGDVLVSNFGAGVQGKAYHFKDTTSGWVSAQQKTKINQEPLFDIFDATHTSFSDGTRYPSSTFVGNKLLSYKRATTGSADTKLGFALTYKNFDSIGDIVFENNYIKDTFQYTKSDTGATNLIVKSGHVHKFKKQSDGTTKRTLENGWRKVMRPSEQWQIVQYDVDTEFYSFEIGSAKTEMSGFSTLKVYLNNLFVDPSKYTEVTINDKYFVTFTDALNKGDVVTIKVISSTVNSLGYYAVPLNLENNANNEDFTEITVGQARNHLTELATNIPTLVGNSLGSNNIRDIDYKKYPGKILQHSASNMLPQYLLTSKDVNFETAMRYGMEEYTRFKTKFLDNINKLDIDLRNPSEAVDTIISHMAGTKTDTFPFFYTDMIAWGSQKNVVYHQIDDTKQKEFEFTTEYKENTVSDQSVLVYIKRNYEFILLVNEQDYTILTDKIAIQLSKNYVTLVGDELQIVEYNNTNGSFVPPTPTKMGLWPKWYPQKYTDDSYSNSQTVVQGHDGSIWVGYGDMRDDIVLELEKRIFNNIKTNYTRDLFNWDDVIPGYFRNTLEDRNTFVNIYRKYFASWAYKNRLDYTTNTSFDKDDSFTWNYSNTTFTNKWRLPGYWRGVYRWLYDTDTPHSTPWEMFGYKIKPTWWEQRYGPAPYTAGNTVLWEDLRDGKIYADGTSTTYTVDTKIKRTDILDMLPVDAQGNLVSPNDSVTITSGGDNANRNSWTIGDAGPVENAWIRSSEWAFTCQIAGALIKPSKYFTLLFDTNLFSYNADYDQILQKDRTYRPKINDLRINGVTVNGVVNRVEGYNQFLENYMTGYGKNKSDLQTRIQNLTQNLAYKVAGFTDKSQLKVIIEVASPSSVSQNIFLPDENLAVHLQESQPLDRVFYSGVNIIKRINGYEVKGFDIDDPVFRIIPSQRSQNVRLKTIGSTTFTLYDDFKREIALVPYNTLFTSINQVADFLNAYNRYLNYKGITFESQNSNGKLLDFNTGIDEFGLWIEQNWEPGTVLSISPGLQQLTIDRPLTTVADLSKTIALRNNNSAPIKVKDYNVERIDNKTIVSVNNENEYMYSAKLDPVQYEHVLVFDNITIFNDIIYQPSLGNRQERLKIVGTRSGNWNGTLQAPGSTLSQDTVAVWQSQQDYKRADTVSFRNKIYVASKDHTGSITFDNANWLLVKNMKSGLLQNTASKANSFQSFYDTDSINLESATDKAGKGQIGFRNREYLENLGLDDTSQIKFYQGMLKNKGTTAALDKLIKAKLTNLEQEINVYEEWGFRVGEYGSIGSNQVIELEIDEANAQKNPFNLQLIDNGEAVDADVIGVIEKSIYKKPDNYTKNIFLDRGTGTFKNDLLSAGFPRLDDVDFTVFSIDDLETELTENIDTIGRADKIWIASRNSTWDMLRVSETAVNIITVEQNVEPQITFSTDGNHGLVKGDYVIVKGSNIVKGCYKIISVQSPTQFTVIDENLTVDAINNTLLPLFKLESVRYATPNLISTTNPLYGWAPNEKIWVDSTSTGKWAVFNKRNPYDASTQISANSISASDQQGASVDVSADGLTFISGSPGRTTVVNFAKDENGTFNETGEKTISSISSTLDGFADSVAYGKEWVAVGAPSTDTNRGAVFIYNRTTTGDINIKQAIVPSIGAQNDEFGYSLAISNDDRFLFVGSPGSDEVYMYSLTTHADTEDNIATLTCDGSTTTYALGFTPVGGDELLVQDRNGKTYLNVTDYTVSGSNITFNSVPVASLVVVVRRSSHFKFLHRISGTASSRFGHSIAVDAIGQTLVVGAPHDSSSVNKAGSISIYHQEIERFIGDGTTTDFTTTGTIPTNMEFIEVNGTTLIPADGAFGGFTSDSSANRYRRSGNTISTQFIPSTGDIIEVYIGQWNKVQDSAQGDDYGLLASELKSDSELFGWSVSIDTYGAIIAVGAPGEDSVNVNTGSVYVFIDEARRFGNTTTKATSFDTDSGSTIFINNVEVALTNTSDPATVKATIDAKNISEVTTSVAGNLLTISSTNKTTNNKLSVRPGTGADYESTSKLNFEPFVMAQRFNNPNGSDNENFGLDVRFDRFVPVGNDAEQTLVVSSDRATTLLSTRFDVVDTADTTTFDNGSTQYIENVNESGAAYVYALLEPAGVAGVNNSPLYAYGQQLRSTTIDQFDSFGCAIAVLDNRIYVGSKNDDQFKTNGGSTYEFTNTTRTAVWNMLRTQDDKVDIGSINRVITYDKRNQQIISFLDTIDIAKGKLPGRAQAELDFITEYDPAIYSIGNSTRLQVNTNNAWNNEYVSKTWWDITQCRILDYEQGELAYRRNNWNAFFPGSEIVVCEWVESQVLPSEYVANGGEGVPLYPDDSAYSQNLQFNSISNTTKTLYYYWVTNKDSYPNNDIRTMSTNSVEAQITDPVAAGIKFMSLIGQNAMMFNNIKPDLKDKNTIVAINYDKLLNDGVLHSEFDLVAEDDPDQIIPIRIWNKIVDSMSGADIQSNIIPDPTLSAGEKYGIGIRPRQTMFVNRQEAAKVMVDFVNKEFAKLPIVRNNVITGFTVSDPIPTKNSGEWNQKVADITTRDYLNTEILSAGYLVLVEQDTNFDNQWTIYILEGEGDQKSWALRKIQGYDTARYWDYVTWYATGYDVHTVPNYQVTNEPQLLTLTQATEGQIAKVLSNDDGNFSLFCKKGGNWVEVVIERGTIKLRDTIWDYSNANYGSYVGYDNSNFDFGQFDRIPQIELRQLLNTIKNDIFINEQRLLFNTLFFRLIEYSLHEQNFGVDWVFKSSFIKTIHKQRDLNQYPTYKNDNSLFIEQFIQEVKPYHTKIREYITAYDGNDNFNGDITDFDVHTFYDEKLGYFRKPSGDYQGDNITRIAGVNKPWADNYGYYLNTVEIYAAGTGYTSNPEVTVSLPDLVGGTQATVQAISNGDSIVSAQVLNKGSGYTKTPTITINTGTAGTGCVLLPRIKNDTHREFDTTLKFDRITYSSNIKTWSANTAFEYEDLVVYQNPDTKVQELYQVHVTGGTTTGATFSTEDSTGTVVFVAYADENVASAADRIEAYYVPSTGMIGDDLALLQEGTDYTSTRVGGVGFDKEPGFDSANFDTLGFDDFEIDVDGLRVLSGQSAFDTTISSTFKDLALGTRPEDINIDGGAFVDEYNSHAPEEVVPGRVFDTLDMEVYTDPSDDFEADGNSFPITYRTYLGDGSTKRFNYAGDIQADQVTLVIAYLGSTPERNFTIDYETRELVFDTAPAANSNIFIYGYGSTGEKLTHEETIIADGSTLAYALAIPFTRVAQMQVLVDGQETTDFTFTEVDGRTVVSFISIVPGNGQELHFLTSSLAAGRLPFTTPVQKTFTLDGSNRTIAIGETVQYGEPLEGNIIVELNGIRLTPTNASHYTLDGSTTYYRAPISKGETIANTIDGQIGVTHIKKSTNQTVNLDRYQDYNITTLAEAFDVTADSSVTTVDADSVTADQDGSGTDYRAVQLNSALTSGDSLIVYYNNGEYTTDGTNLYINEEISISNGDELVVTMFSNHDPLRIQTQVFKGLGTDITTVAFDYDGNAYDSNIYDGLTESGTAQARYSLDRTLTATSNLNYLWVTVNGTKLHPGQYGVDGTGRLDLSNFDGVTLDADSIITITSISENIVQPTTGFRVFYNMLGETEYFRLCADTSTKLSVELKPADTRVYVSNASVLTQVTPTSQYPGVLFVGNERITYWEIDTTNNYVTNIRRGTGGTRFATEHRVGTTVVNSSEDERLPQINTHTNTWYDLGTGTAANGLGLQQSAGLNAQFLKDCEAIIPNYLVELSANSYIVDGYVAEGYIEEQQ